MSEEFNSHLIYSVFCLLFVVIKKKLKLVFCVKKNVKINQQNNFNKLCT